MDAKEGVVMRMTYEKPTITFQKFHTDAFLENTDVLSNNNPDQGQDVWDPEGGFVFENGVFNGTISINSDGVGGWLNG